MNLLKRITHIIAAIWSRIRKDLGRDSLLAYRRLIKNWLKGVKPTKRAFLVVGPESHGNHLVTDILINAGCIGHAGNHMPWQPENKVLLRDLEKPWESESPTDVQPWDKKPPIDEDPIVWRRSIPHGNTWIDITRVIRDLKSRGYLTTVIIVTRDTYSGIQSQLKWGHVVSLEEGKAKISQAYIHIFRHLLWTQVTYTMVNYEALALYPKAQDFLLQQLGLPLPERRWPAYDGNRKWYDYELNNAPGDFPEGWYPCRSGDTQSYFDRVRMGYKKMTAQTVIICGLARDVIGALPNVMASIERLGEKFKDYSVIVVENDSIDGTQEMLSYWQRVNPKVELLSEQLNARKWGPVQDVARTTEMAKYRNRYLDHIREKQYTFDYLIVMDFDLPLGFSYDGIAHSFSFTDWDVVGSNGILVPPFGNPIPNPIFFDAFAFRPKGQAAPQEIEAINRLQFQRGEDLVPVESVFGGLAIYKSAGILAGASYGGEDCEHVVFHQWLHEYGFNKQFLNPSQIVLYSEANAR